jgi:hypothetical protein
MKSAIANSSNTTYPQKRADEGKRGREEKKREEKRSEEKRMRE